MCCLWSATVKFCGEEKFPKSIDGIMDWFYSFPEELRKSGKWECSHAEFIAILKMRDGAGQYFLTINPTPQPNRFIGCPVIVEGENDSIGK